MGVSIHLVITMIRVPSYVFQYLIYSFSLNQFGVAIQLAITSVRVTICLSMSFSIQSTSFLLINWVYSY